MNMSNKLKTLWQNAGLLILDLPKIYWSIDDITLFLIIPNYTRMFLAMYIFTYSTYIGYTWTCPK